MPNDRDTTTATRAAFEAWVNRTSTGEPDFQSAAAMWAWAAWQAALAAAPSPVPAQEPFVWLIVHSDSGVKEWSRDRERAYLAQHLGHAVTPLYAAPVGQADPWPEDPTPEMLEALRTGSRKDYPSDELCRVRYVALRAAVGAVGGQAEDAARWQPIETAPKDGREVLLADRGDVGAGFWDAGQECYGHRGGAGWFYEGDRYALLTARNCHPTHWMPLPPPPSDLQAVQPQPGDAR